MIMLCSIVVMTSTYVQWLLLRCLIFSFNVYIMKGTFYYQKYLLLCEIMHVIFLLDLILSELKNL